MWKKKAAATALVLIMVIQSALPAFAAVETNENTLGVSAKAAETEESARIKENINKGWQFKYYGSDTGTPTAEAFDDSQWDTVNVPHTWNNLDGQDGGNNMARGNGWYRKKLDWKSEYTGKQIFLEFLGASRDVTIYVNGNQVGEMHRGAYTAFRYDITEELKNGTNVIAVKTDNTNNASVIPLSGDFNVYGGIYRDVSLVIADPVHVDMEDYGSNGLYLQTGDVSETSGGLTVRSTIVNDGTQNAQVTVKAVVKEGVDSFEEIEEIPDPMFDVEDMLVKDKEPVATLTDTFTLAPGNKKEFSKSVTVSNPHLWNGLTDPFRYQVDLTVEVDGKVVDNVSDYVGFRYFNVNIDTGFYLNGVSCPLRGVSRHQDWEDMGCAISTKEHDVDFGMIYEIGANTIRLAHYPHDPYFYDLCDRYGMVVWAEIPFVDQVGTADDFYEITERQLIEMIRQQYNRPGICFWGLQNEVGNSGNPGGNNSAGMSNIMVNLNNKAHAEDTTGRLTTQATNGDSSWVSDLLAWNTYPGWYNGGLSAFEGNIDGKKSTSRPVGISEYGFGGNIEQHEIPANKPASTTGQWHPEEYQSLGHEKAVEVFDTRKWVWGTYVWCMFDFACDKRAEGDNPGINDKGIVTYDRKIRKDSFYIYKANWNKREKFAHITSSRIDTNDISSIPFVKVYSNCESVELIIDGVSKGQMTKEGYGIFKWTSELAVRENMVIEAVATDTDGKTYTDRVTLNRKRGTVAELQSDVLVVNNEQKTIGLIGNIDVSDLADILTGVRGATYYVTDEDGEQVTAGNVTFGMKAVVTSEDEETTEIYTFVSTYISAGKTVTASSEQTGTTDYNPKENAVDGNSETRWAANTGGGNQWICVDLGEEYFLSQIRIDWFNTNANKRSYQYTIDISDDATNWENSVIDRSNNSQQDSITDVFPTGTTGRYVRISVSGIRNSSGNSVTNINASMYEIAIHGWNITSTAYDIDHSENIIRIPDNVPMVGGNLPDYAFMEGLEIKGNYTYKLDMNSYFITGNNDSLTITDEAAEEKVYNIYFATGSPEITGDVIDVTGITLSESSCSMETGQTKRVGLTLTPANATRRAVLWESSNPEVATVSRNGKLTAVGEGEAVITATSAYSGVVSNELKVSVALSDGSVLKGVLAEVEAALEQLHVTNDTTAADVMEAVQDAVTMEGITAQWKTDFQKVESTETERGSITGQIRLELGESSVTLKIDKTISSGKEVMAVLNEEKDNAQAAIQEIHVTNAVTQEEILAEVIDAITNENVTAEWNQFHKTEASQTQDGSVEGEIQLTLDGKTIILEINLTIAKTGGSQTECSCEIESLSVSGGHILIGANEESGSFQLSPDAAIKAGCQMEGHPDANHISYSFAIKTGAQNNTADATVNGRTGLVTATKEGKAIITVTATLASGADGKTSKSADVEINVTKAEEGVFAVTFDANAGSDRVTGMPDPVAVKQGEKLAKPSETPVRSGYTFEGWSRTPNGGAIADTDWPQDITTDETFYAVWEANGGDAPVTKEEAEEAASEALLAADSLRAAGQGNYTKESWDKFNEAYQALKAARENAGTSPEELKKMADDLDAARKNLALDNKKILNGANTAVKADAAAILGGNTKYTAATWKAYANAYAALKNEAGKGDAADAAKLDTLKKAFDTAKRSLKVDTIWQNAKTALTRSLSQAQAIYANGKGNNNKKYTDASWKTFSTAYAAAYAQRNAIAGNSTANRLNTLAKALNDAKAKLAPAPVLKIGDSVTQGGVTYVVLDPVRKTASAQGEASKKKKKFKVAIKDTVDINNVTCTVTEVKAKGFTKFTKITRVTIGKNVTKIGRQAFKGCKAITKLTVNGNVKTFDIQCFQNCKKLKKIAFMGNMVPTLKSKAFKGTASQMTVKLAKKMSKSNKKKMKNKLKTAGINKKAKIS